MLRMDVLGPLLVCGLILQSAVGKPFDSMTYVATLPKIMISEQPTQACLTIENDEDCMAMVTMNFRYKETPLSDEYSVTNTYDFNLQFGGSNITRCTSIRAPTKQGTYLVDVKVVLSVKSSQDETVLSFVNDQIYVDVPEEITLVQTDKPIYKPGETMKFRVLTIDTELMAKTDGVSDISVKPFFEDVDGSFYVIPLHGWLGAAAFKEIVIRSPDSLRMKQWKNVSASNGLVSLEMPLSADPVLGTWRIDVDDGTGIVAIQNFKVDEYVLPKFEVTITPPKYLLPTSQMIHGEVCAKYTYGKPVRGNVAIELCYKSYYTYYYSQNRQERPCAMILQEIDGCSEFHVNAEDIELGHRSYGGWGRLIINATVTEAETGVELVKASEGPGLSYEALNLVIEDESDGYFKPGFPYKGKVLVTNPDGTPAPEEVINVRVSSYDIDYQWTKNFTSDRDGIIQFTITELDDTVGTLSLTASAIVYESDWRYTEDEIYIRTYTPNAYTSLTKVYSKSNSYIYVPTIKGDVDCGGSLDIDVYFSTEPDQEIKLFALVSSFDKRYLNNMMTTVTPAMTLDADITGVNPAEVLVKSKKPESELWPRPHILIAYPEPVEPLPDAFDADGNVMEPVEEEMIVPEKASVLGTEDEVPPKVFKTIGMSKLHVNVPHGMTGRGSVLLYYKRDDGEIVATSVPFTVKTCFKNKVNMGFDVDTAAPGNDVTLNLEASKNSFCFIGMMDKSVAVLAGNNQIVPSVLFERVQSARVITHWFPYWDEDQEYCERYLKENKEEEPTTKDPLLPYIMHDTYAKSVGRDATHVFRNEYLWIETNGFLDSRPCVRESRIVSLTRAEPLAMVGSVPEATGVRTKDNNVQESAGSKTERIRSFFPETWLWDIVAISDDGQFSMTTTVPDTITQWVGNALCTHPDDGVGISELTNIITFKPFFISMKLPYSAVRGEVLPLTLTVFSYLEPGKCFNMELRLHESDGFEVSPGSSTIRQFCLCGGLSEGTTIYIVPTIVGEIEITSTAVSLADSSLCSNVVLDDTYVGVSDGVQRQLLVDAEGEPQEVTFSSYMCNDKEEKVDLSLPDNLVPDSQSFTLGVHGDIMGPALDNLDNLLRMPYGCGEQNAASWAPNIYILRYLTTTQQVTEEIQAKAENFMTVGYQRQMKYRHSDGSYSVWGENSAYSQNGSIWLTAFVVKCMAQSSNIISIDMDDVKQSAAWIISLQGQDGCFPQVGEVHSSYLRGGLDDGNLAGLTAFVITALIEANAEAQFDQSILEGIRCLNDYDVQEMDIYTLALVSFAYSLFDTQTEHGAAVMVELERRKIQSSGQIHWGPPAKREEPTGYYYWYRAPSAEVEMTSYVLMSLLAGGKRNIGESASVVQWLARQRNPYGGFASTQDTVVALQALSVFGMLTYTEGGEVSVKAKGEESVIEYTVTPENRLLYFKSPLRTDESMVDISTQGRGCALVQVTMKFNLYAVEESGPAFDVETRVFRSFKNKHSCDQRTIRICAKYLHSGGMSNMAIVEVKMPTGWVPDTDSVNELTSQGDVSKAEIDKNFVELYFSQLTRDRTCVHIDVTQEIRVDTKPALINVYDYYETEKRVTVGYEIRTTCGTKEEIPLDNEGIDCTVMQCRVVEPPVPKALSSCPSCPDKEHSADEVQELVCGSEHVYKAIVGRKGEYPIKLKADIRPKKKEVLDQFVTFKIGTGCRCPLLDSDSEARALIFTGADAVNKPKAELHLQAGDTVIQLTVNKLERVVRRIAARSKICDKMRRLKRSSKKASRKRLFKIQRQLGIRS